METTKNPTEKVVDVEKGVSTVEEVKVEMVEDTVEEEKTSPFYFDPTIVELRGHHTIGYATIGKALKCLFTLMERRNAESNPYETAFNSSYDPHHLKFVEQVKREFCSCSCREELEVVQKFSAGRLPNSVRVWTVKDHHEVKGNMPLDKWQNHINYLLSIISSRAHYGATRSLPSHITEVLNDSRKKGSREAKWARQVKKWFPSYQKRCDGLLRMVPEWHQRFSDAHDAGLTATGSSREQVERRREAMHQQRLEARRTRRVATTYGMGSGAFGYDRGIMFPPLPSQQIHPTAEEVAVPVMLPVMPIPIPINYSPKPREETGSSPPLLTTTITPVAPSPSPA